MVTVSDIFKFINKIRDFFSKKKDKIIVPKGDEARDIIGEIYSGNPSADVEITKFCGEFTRVVVKKGEIGFIPKENLKTIPKDKIVNLLSESIGERYTKFKNEPKPVSNRVFNLLPKLNQKYKALISLSVEAEKFYGDSLDGQAENIKVEANKEWDDGSKFVNLWSSGYIKTIFDFISVPETITSDELNKLLDSFVDKAHSIFFIHHWTDKDEIITKINGLLANNENYVAIHSLGSNNSMCQKIIKDIRTDISSDYIKKDILIDKRGVKGRGKIWYRKKEGLDIYKLIEPYL